MLDKKYLIILVLLVIVILQFCKNKETFSSIDNLISKAEVKLTKKQSQGIKDDVVAELPNIKNNTELNQMVKDEVTKQMSASFGDKITEGINTIYKTDIDSIRNLAKVSNALNSKTGTIIPGNLTLDGNLDIAGNFNYLPKGSIIAFNGKKSPAGWAICDGKNGTPDLRGKFIYGSGKGNVVGNKGGKDKVTLTTPEMPRHNHGASGLHRHNTLRFGSYCGSLSSDQWAKGKSYRGGQKYGMTNGSNCVNTSNEGNHTHRNEGEGKPFSIMPPYVVLMYIMKL